MKRKDYKDYANGHHAAIFILESGWSILRIWTKMGRLIENRKFETFRGARISLTRNFQYMEEWTIGKATI